MTHLDRVQPSPGYAKDITILDSEPWNNPSSPINQLVRLQQEVFDADRDGHLANMGRSLLEMSQIEEALDNLAEAATLTLEGAEALTAGGASREAIAAHTVAAKEWRDLETPGLAMTGLRNALELRTTTSGLEAVVSVPASVDEELRPVINATNSVIGYYATREVWPPRRKHGLNRQDVEAVTDEMLRLLGLPISGDSLTVYGTFFAIGKTFQTLGKGRLGLSRAVRGELKTLGSKFISTQYGLHTASYFGRKVDLSGQATVGELLTLAGADYSLPLRALPH